MTDKQPAPAEPQAQAPNPRQPAYDAVYAYIRGIGDYLPPDPAHRNAIIWRAVHAALDATPVGRCISSHCVEGDHILDLDQPADESHPYRDLLSRLQAEQARGARNSAAAGLDQARWVAEGIDAGLQIAIAHAITLFEGHAARVAYFAAHQTPDAAAEPTVAEVAADDRRHWADKYAGDQP